VGGEVEDPRRPDRLDDPGDGNRVGQVGPMDPQVGEDVLEPAGVALGAQQQVDLVAVREQPPDEVGADEPASPGDEDAPGQSPKAS
jgi:hypothetical protein